MRQLRDKTILDTMCCPICKSGFVLKDGKALACTGTRTHCYDLSASGYVNLASSKQSGGGDSKEAVRARSEFLNLGYYEPIAKALASVCSNYKPNGGVLLDAGCGEGYYSNFLARENFGVIGIDISKFAVDAASKRLAREGFDNFLFSVASVFELPVMSDSIDVVTNVFAPCAESEYSRVLKENGILVVLWAGEKHLWGLKNALYDKTHQNSERADLPTDMVLVDTRRVSYMTQIKGNEQIKALFGMTPYYWRTSPKDADKLSHIDMLETEIDIMISVYKKEGKK